MKKFNPSRRSFLNKAPLAITGAALLSSQISFATLIGDSSPFEGYNPFVEEKNDLRTFNLFGKTVKVSGKVFQEDGIETIPNAKIEVWHLSPNSKNYKHRGSFSSNPEGIYTFWTDFPNKTYGKRPRIFFKITDGNKSDFTELIMDSNYAHISDVHWEKNRILGDKLFPEYKKSGLESEIEFNFTI